MAVEMKEHDTIALQRPQGGDGAAVWALIRDAGGLDVNSAYCYMLLCDHFRDTCVIARKGTRAVGFVSAYEKPRERSGADGSTRGRTLFVWQIAVASDERGNGVGGRLLQTLVERCSDQFKDEAGWYVEATVGPSNEASRALFHRLARSCGVALVESDGYRSDSFPEGLEHDDERLLTLGPFSHNDYKKGV